MTWEQIWKKIGKQPLYVSQHGHPSVFVDGKEYQVTAIRYKNGVPVGFETKPVEKQPTPVIELDQDYSTPDSVPDFPIHIPSERQGEEDILTDDLIDDMQDDFCD